MGVRSHAVRCSLKDGHPWRASRGHGGLVRRNPLRGGGGFTLIELLVVIGIIAVLAAIVIPVYTRAMERGRQASCLSNMHAITVAMRMYQMDYDAFPPVYEPVSGTGGIGALYHGDYLSDPQSLRCPDDNFGLAGYRERYFGGGNYYTNYYMKTTVWEPGPPPNYYTYPGPDDNEPEDQPGPRVLEWGHPRYRYAWDQPYFREHYSTYNCSSVNPEPNVDGAATVSYQLYDYYGYDATGLGHLDLTTTQTPDEEYAAGTRTYDTSSIKFAGLYNSHAPDTTIITHCPRHRAYFGRESSWQDVIVRIGGNAELMRITQYDWRNQPPKM